MGEKYTHNQPRSNEMPSKSTSATKSENGQEQTGQMLTVDINRIRPFKEQPRTYFESTGITNLSKSIRNKQRLPISVMRIEDDPRHDFEIIDGERRFRAAKEAGVNRILVWIKTIRSKDEQFIDSVVSNFGRENHTVLEKVNAFTRLRQWYSAEEIAELCGCHFTTVYQYLSLSKLVPEALKRLDPSLPEDEMLNFSTAARLATLDPEIQLDVLEQISGKKMPHREVRHFVRARAHESGKLSSSKTKPDKYRHRHWNMFTGFVNRSVQEAKSIADMPDSMFVEAVTSRTRAEMEYFEKEANALIREIEKLKNKVMRAKKTSSK
ncbi:MAG: ParB/RepB/Spo0J family partition protein [Candidatus Paceibacterota bacterium]